MLHTHTHLYRSQRFDNVVISRYFLFVSCTPKQLFEKWYKFLEEIRCITRIPSPQQTGTEKHTYARRFRVCRLQRTTSKPFTHTLTQARLNSVHNVAFKRMYKNPNENWQTLSDNRSNGLSYGCVCFIHFSFTLWYRFSYLRFRSWPWNDLTNTNDTTPPAPSTVQLFKSARPATNRSKRV